jgi:hemerythrin
MESEQNFIEWKPEYILGIEDIDLQHHFFLNLINRLANEFTLSNHIEYKTALIRELNAYASFHFISEENMMFRAGYPLLEQHKKHHLDLIEKLSNKGNSFRLNPTIEEGKNTINFLVNWFFEHTSKEDRLFTDYLHAAKS